jgi:hypothetical protein
MSETHLTIRANEIQAGDFLDVIEGKILYGPRGGKYRWRGLRVESRVVRVEELLGRGTRIVPTTGEAFVLPGNLADVVDARVRRNLDASTSEWKDDEELLRDSESPVRAVRLAATAELERRTR